MEEANPLKVYPLGIVTLGTHLKRRGFDVQLLDLNIEPDAFGALIRELREFGPDAIGISLRNIDPLANKTSSLIPPFKATVRVIAKVAPDVPVIVGGTGYSLFPERILEELPEINYGLAGEAEETLPELLEWLEASGLLGSRGSRGSCGSLDVPPALQGLYLQRNGQSQLSFLDADQKPVTTHARAKNWGQDYLWPDRTLLDLKRYLSETSYVPAVGIETQRGCPYRCAYCVYPKLQGCQVRVRPPEDVVNEIEYLHKELGVNRVHFNDAAVNMVPGHLEGICELLLSRGLNIMWGGFFREDRLENIDLFARAGCECFAFSPDALSEQGLKSLDKGLTVEDIVKAATLAAATDVLSIYHFMVNVPGESLESVAESRKLMELLFDIHTAKRNLGTIILNNIRIFPDTPMETAARANGVLDDNTDLLYPTYYNPPPYNNLRYELEALQLEKNITMWQEV
jgi:putative variant cofactor biosynthesis B12-binding/radical SAM domain protein 1